MTKRIGITGGIGSGKSYVCGIFRDKFGVIVYDSDTRAKFLMVLNTDLQHKIINAFGVDSYLFKDGDFILNKEKFAKLLFEDDNARLLMNSIVHPFVRKEYNNICDSLNEKYIIFESAILFDSDVRIKTDLNILVTADMDLRIKRIQERNNLTIDQVMKRISNQSDDEYKKQFADFVINNNGDQNELERQIIEIHNKILML